MGRVAGIPVLPDLGGLSWLGPVPRRHAPRRSSSRAGRGGKSARQKKMCFNPLSFPRVVRVEYALCLYGIHDIPHISCVPHTVSTSPVARKRRVQLAAYVFTSVWQMFIRFSYIPFWNHRSFLGFGCKRPLRRYLHSAKVGSADNRPP